MLVHMRRLSASAAAMLTCCCLPSLPAAGYSPPVQQLRNLQPHTIRTHNDNPLSLVAPPAFETKGQTAQLSAEPTVGLLHYATPARATGEASFNTNRSILEHSADTNKHGPSAIAGAALAGAAAVAGAALGNLAVVSEVAGDVVGQHSVYDEEIENVTSALHSLESHGADDCRSCHPNTHGTKHPASSSPKSLRSSPSAIQKRSTAYTSPQIAHNLLSSKIASSRPPFIKRVVTQSHLRSANSFHSEPSMGKDSSAEKATSLLPSPHKRKAPQAFIGSKALLATSFEEETKDPESGERLTSPESHVSSGSEAPEEFTASAPSLNDPTERVPLRKSENTAWLCRISELQKGCNTREYYPGMHDRAYGDDSSTGRAYRYATCPEGSCCSKTACSSAGCGNICTDSTVLCLFQHESRSNGKNCSCADNPVPSCDPLATCRESLKPGGGAWCECPPGYLGNGLVCCKAGSNTPGCDKLLRRPGVQHSTRSGSENTPVIWATLWLLVATGSVSGAL